MKKAIFLLILFLPIAGIFSGEYLKYSLLTIYLYLIYHFLVCKDDPIIGKILKEDEKLNFLNFRRKDKK